MDNRIRTTFQKKPSFTLVELITVSFAALAIGIVGIPFYRNTLENAKSQVCRTNLRMIQDAVELYGAEHDVLPDSLAEIPQATVEKAWAAVFHRENPWVIKAAYFLVDWDQQGFAYAQESFNKRYFGGNRQYLRCPSDTIASSGVSYGLNEHLRRLSFKQYEQLRKTDPYLIVAGDCRQEFFGSLSALDYRHRTIRFLKERPFANVSLSTAQGPLPGDLDVQSGVEGKAFAAADQKNVKSVAITLSVARDPSEYLDIELLQNKYEKLLKRVQSMKNKGVPGWSEIEKNMTGLLSESEAMLTVMKERFAVHQKEETQFRTELQENVSAVKARLDQLEQNIQQSRGSRK